MVNPIFREFYAERDVITEERRMSENRPGFFFNEQLNATFYGAHPYSSGVIGWMSDVSNITRDEMKEYRDLYYRPDNATLVMAGDIDVDAVMALVEQYFGDIPSRGKSPTGEDPGAQPGISIGRPWDRISTHRTSRRGFTAGPPRPLRSRFSSTSHPSGTTIWLPSTCWARS